MWSSYFQDLGGASLETYSGGGGGKKNTLYISSQWIKNILGVDELCLLPTKIQPSSTPKH